MYSGIFKILTFYIKKLGNLDFQHFNILHKNFYVFWNLKISAF